MDKNRKELKSFSIVILAFVALDLIKIIISLFVKGLPLPNEIPEGMSKDIVQITTIIIFAVSLIILIPQIYVGVKGLMIANGAKSGNAHIIWAIILVALSAIATISGIVDITKAFSFDAVLNILSPAVDVVIFAFYYFYAKKIAG
jgi:hypothetical protein